MTLALVPLRSPGQGKTRLSGVLTTEQRAALAGAMLADVIGALRDAEVDRIAVAASGPAAAAAASALGVEVSLDPPGVDGLDAAISAAARRLGGCDELVVVAADLPRLTAADVLTVMHSDAEVVVAPTRGGGTGGLLRRPADRITTAYGHGSAARHLAIAERVGATSATVQTPGFHEDVDLGSDLERLGSGRLGAATAQLLARWRGQVDAAS